MEKQKIMLYLSDVLEVEKQKRIAEDTINNYIVKEYKKAQSNAEEDKKVYKEKIKPIHYIFFLIGLWLIYGSLVTLDEVLDSSYNDGLFGWVLVLIIIIAAIACFRYPFKKRKDEQKLVNAMSAVLAKKGREDMAVLNENYQVVLKAYNESKKILDVLYSLNIIYPKYRYLEACGMFLEYFKAGRTNSLEANGEDRGAYNIYEDELFKGIVINKLDQVLENQRILINGQRQISAQINGLISGMNQMRKDVKDMKIAAQTNTFYNTVIAYNTTVMRRISENQYLG